MKITNLHKLSDQELIEIYQGKSSMKVKAKAELTRRGIKEIDGRFTKRLVKTAKNIEMFLRITGFEYLASLTSHGVRYPSGCCEYHLSTDKKNHIYQINGVGLSEIETPLDSVIFSIQNCDTMLSGYVKEYDNFFLMVEGEKDKVDFTNALKNWRLN